jgi:hypothetical protein
MALLTPSQAAESLFAILPHDLAGGQLEEYGIEAESEQAQEITREVLALNLYWVQSALQAVRTKAADKERVLGALRDRILHGWTTEFGLDGQDAQAFFQQAEERRQAYDQIVQEGGGPVAVFTECAAILESASAVKSEDRRKILALLIDLIPVDQIGELVGDWRLAGP